MEEGAHENKDIQGSKKSNLVMFLTIVLCCLSLKNKVHSQTLLSFVVEITFSKSYLPII